MFHRKYDQLFFCRVLTSGKVRDGTKIRIRNRMRSTKPYHDAAILINPVRLVYVWRRELDEGSHFKSDG